MGIDHVLTVLTAGLMLIGFLMPSAAAYFIRYETRRLWLFAVIAPFFAVAFLLGVSFVPLL